MTKLKDELLQGIPLMHKVRCIHFVGIGGAGMCGIAEVLRNEGYAVQGSDVAESKVTERLRNLGIKIFIGHAREHVQQVSVVVVSSAIHPDNPEIAEAIRLRIPVVRRAEMLGELMRYRYGIAASTDTALACGVSLIINGSRAAFPQARRRYPGLLPVLVTVEPSMLRERLIKRGRESEAEVEERLTAAFAPIPEEDAVEQWIRIDNSGPLEENARNLAEKITSALHLA